MNIHEKLKRWMCITQEDSDILDYLNAELKKAQPLSLNNESNRLFLYKTILLAHLKYIQVINLLTRGDFYEAWVELERIEIDLIHIKENNEFLPEVNFYGVNFLARMVCNWQALFPYKIFGSSREIIKEVKCSVCNTTRSFINDCGHVKNKLYNGVLCFDEVIDFELITYDIVSNPVNKCSVFFSNDGDHYNYSTLISVVKYIQSPHQIFNITTWRFKAKEHDGVLSPENICPCGDSLKKYADCCLPRNGIYKKHIDIWFPFPLNVEPI